MGSSPSWRRKYVFFSFSNRYYGYKYVVIEHTKWSDDGCSRNWFPSVYYLYFIGFAGFWKKKKENSRVVVSFDQHICCVVNSGQFRRTLKQRLSDNRSILLVATLDAEWQSNATQANWATIWAAIIIWSNNSDWNESRHDVRHAIKFRTIHALSQQISIFFLMSKPTPCNEWCMR